MGILGQHAPPITEDDDAISDADFDYSADATQDVEEVVYLTGSRTLRFVRPGC